MQTLTLIKKQTYFGYARRRGRYELVSGSALVRNLSLEIEGIPQAMKLEAGQCYRLPDSGWMMISPYTDCELRYYEPEHGWSRYWKRLCGRLFFYRRKKLAGFDT